ncbi:MAG TPA: class I SAM-dependent methyltransferase [Cytophagales bacterium]|nr:class I SAM-dependent methyltransferase [Cytophagales bacterium]
MDFKFLAAQLRKPEGDFGKDLGEKMNVSNKYINNRTLELLNVIENEKVLEIGMGNGYLCNEILMESTSATYTGCDFSELMVEEASARNNFWVKNNRASFKLSDASKLPFNADYFDKIFTVNTLYFWEDPVEELNEIKRVLKPGGLFILSIRTKRSMENLPFSKYGFNLYEEQDVLKQLIKVGFSRIETEVEEEPEIKIEESAIRFQSIYAKCWK